MNSLCVTMSRMNWSNIWKQILDILKGAIGAALTYALLGFLQYLAGHIPDLITQLSMGTGSVIAIKTYRN